MIEASLEHIVRDPINNREMEEGAEDAIKMASGPNERKTK